MESINAVKAILPTQEQAWLQAAAERLGGREDAALAALRSRVSQAGLTAIRIGNGPQRLAPIGAAETGEPSDLPWSSDDDLKQRAEALAAQAMAVELPRVPAGSLSLAALRGAFARRRGFVVTRQAPGTPFIELDESWKEPESRFNAGRRSDFRRAQRHAEKTGALTFEWHQNLAPHDLDRLLDEAYAVEARSWKGEGGTALSLDPVLGPFFRRYAQLANTSGVLRLAFMRIGGQAVGMQLAAEHEGSLWLLKIGYDPAHAKASPGNLLMLYTLGEAARRGLRSYEFLGSVAPWTEAWTTTLRPYLSVRFYPRSVAGALALAQDGVKSVRARLREKLAADAGRHKPGQLRPGASSSSSSSSAAGLATSSATPAEAARP